LELFKGASSDGDYLFSIVLPYLVSFPSFGFSVQIYMKHNPFGIIRSISWSDPYYNMLFEDYSDSCDAMYYTKEKLKKNVIYLLLFLAQHFNIDVRLFCQLK